MAGALGAAPSYRQLQRRLAMLEDIVPLSARSAHHGLITLLLVAACGVVPWRVVAAQGDPFADDARLGRNVAITAEGVPLRDLLPLLTQKTGLTFKAEEYVADDKIVIFGPARPLRAVLADMAALFHDVWIKGTSPQGVDYYMLVRDQRARTYELELARAEMDSVRARLDEQARALSETEAKAKQRPENDPIRQRSTMPPSPRSSATPCLPTTTSRFPSPPSARSSRRLCDANSRSGVNGSRTPSPTTRACSR